MLPRCLPSQYRDDSQRGGTLRAIWRRIWEEETPVDKAVQFTRLHMLQHVTDMDPNLRDCSLPQRLVLTPASMYESIHDPLPGAITHTPHFVASAPHRLVVELGVYEGCIHEHVRA